MFNPGFTAPGLTMCPNITVFHDLQHKRHPEHFRRLDKPAWNLFLWISARRSRMFLADSDATKADLMRYYQIPESRIRVAWLGVEEQFFSLAEWRGPIEPFLLCVSTLHPHKNIERLVRVFSEFRRKRPEYRLVLAGMRGFRTDEVERQIQRCGVGEFVQLTGSIPRSELYNYYRRAAAFVYPSTFEGFGLPVLEAMAAGIPLACSDIEPLRSITGDTVVRFDPLSDDDMLRALERVVSGQANVEAQKQRAREFTWDRCAEETLAAIEAAI
jgi:glycosyltransferase involved in cell wall biosynthesis